MRSAIRRSSPAATAAARPGCPPDENAFDRGSTPTSPTDRQQLHRSGRRRAGRRPGDRHIEPGRLRRAARARPHRVDRIRPGGLGHPGESRGEAAAARARLRPWIRPRQTAGGRAQRAIPGRDRRDRRDLRGGHPPRTSPRRRHLARRRGVLGDGRRVAASAGRARGAARRGDAEPSSTVCDQWAER